MKTTIATIAFVLASTAAAFAAPMASDGLKVLAEAGNGDMYAAEIGGMSFHETGGNPAAFDYVVATPWQTGANELLSPNEFLAPHFVHKDGQIWIMVAPHLFVDGAVIKGEGPNDSFIVIDSDGQNGTRYDYSAQVAN